MPYLVPVQKVGGQGGTAFDVNGINNGGTLQKIQVFAGSSQIKGLNVWLTNGLMMDYGRSYGGHSQFEFEKGEKFTSLSLWATGDGKRLAAIKFKTNRCREFFIAMTDWGNTKEYIINVGSGICVGITGRAGEDIDCCGFQFLDTIRSAELINVQYPTLPRVTPSVDDEKIKSTTYQNTSSEIQEYKLETSKKITKKSSWSVPYMLEFTFNFEVKAGIPEVVNVAAGYGFKVGTESTYGLENTEEKTELLSFPVTVPPGKSVDVDIMMGRATVDLPYNGTVQIRCNRGSVVQFPTTGSYKGVTYTDAKAVVKDSAKSL